METSWEHIYTEYQHALHPIIPMKRKISNQEKRKRLYLRVNTDLPKAKNLLEENKE